VSSDEPPTRPPGRRAHPASHPRARHPDPHPGFPTDPDVTGEDVRRLPHAAERRDILLCIALGGALGGLARWGLAEALPHDPDALPWATVLANVSGCFAIGALFVVLADRRPGSHLLRPLLGTGLLGGYTTFSTYALDTRDLLAAGRPFLAAAYLVGTLVVSLLALVASVRFTERMLR
jgi:fluoride exporter